MSDTPVPDSVPAREVSDEALLQEALQGCADAYRTLVERHSAWVLKSLYYLTGDRHEAEDLTQEVFLRAFGSLRQFKGQARFRTYLSRIVHNVGVSRIAYLKAKKRSGRATSLQGAAGAEALCAKSSDPASGLVAEELRRAIQAAIQALAPQVRHLIILRDMEDRSYEEISEIAGLPLGTVKSRIHRGRLLLRERLKKYL